jgi:uncharacterized repeat protein (TIGR03803 family)
MAVAILLMVAASQPALAQTLTELHDFLGTEGANPTAGVTMDAAGNLYGTTQYGGTGGYGEVFKLVHRGSAWILNPLYNFPSYQSGDDGAEPYAGVTVGPDGNLYGTTIFGGGSARFGTVFKLSPPASVCRSTLCPWTETVLYRFTGGSDGAVPYGPVVFDSAGNLYGTTVSGGASSCFSGQGCGVVFKLTRSGSGWTETVLHTFLDAPDGSNPGSGLVFDQAGNLYGTTGNGGTGSCGTVFQLMPSGSGWTENVLHSFDSSGDGCNPAGGLIVDHTGNLYGTTVFSPGNNGNGTVFELTSSGGQWTYTFLSNILEQYFGITGPFGPLAMDATGNLYGTTFGSGNAYGSGFCEYGCGTVFKLTPSAGGWSFNLVYEFTGDVDGAQPTAGVILDRDGNLYGTASSAGAGGYGTVFEITP